MDTDRDARATQFALEILRNHPQISYGNAVAAAGYSGVTGLPRHVFLQAVEKLGIPRTDESLADLKEAPAADDSPLLRQLEQIRSDFAETAAMREAFTNMRRVIRAALGTEQA